MKHIIYYKTSNNKRLKEVTDDDFTAWCFINDITRLGATDICMTDSEKDIDNTLITVKRIN